MKLGLKLIVALAALVAPLHGYAAVEMEYYTYGNFDEVYAALNRLELLFYGSSGAMNADYAFLVAVIAASSIGVSVALSGIRAMGGGSVNPIVWFGPMLLGLAIFKALVIPSGKLYLYDPVLNKTGTTAIELPAIVVAAAGATNVIERVMADMIESTTAYPYSTNAGGAAFNLVYSNLSNPITPDDAYLNKSLRRYVSDCLPDALTSASSTTSLAQLKQGALSCSATEGLGCVLEGLAVNSGTTTYFRDSDRAGITDSCKVIWDSYLKSALTAASFAGASKTVCAQANYKSADSDEKAACDNKFQDVEILLGGDGSNSSSSPDWTLRQAYYAQTINAIVREDSPDQGVAAMANQSMINDGLGASVAANEWIPHIRGMVTALALGIIPFVALFIVTPMVWRALGLIAGLMVFVAVWGVVEAVIHVATVDAATEYFTQAAQYKWGIDGIALAAPAALKVLAMFGKARAMGIVITGSITYGLFKLSDYGFSHMASGLQHNVESQGSAGAQRAATYEGKMSATEGFVRASATDAQVSAIGVGAMSQAAAWRNISHDFQSNAEQRSLSAGGLNRSQAAEMFGTVMAAPSIGNVRAAQARTENTGGNRNSASDVGNVANRAAETEGLQRLGSTDGVIKAAKDAGMSVDNQAAFNTQWNKIMETGGARVTSQNLQGLASTMKKADGNQATIFDAAQLVSKVNQGHSVGMATVLGNNENAQRFFNNDAFKNVQFQNKLEEYANKHGITYNNLIEGLAEVSALDSSAMPMELMARTPTGTVALDKSGNVQFSSLMEKRLEKAREYDANIAIGRGTNAPTDKQAQKIGQAQVAYDKATLKKAEMSQKIGGKEFESAVIGNAMRFDVPIDSHSAPSAIKALQEVYGITVDKHQAANLAAGSILSISADADGQIVRIQGDAGKDFDFKDSSSVQTSHSEDRAIRFTDATSANKLVFEAAHEMEYGKRGTPEYARAQATMLDIMNNTQDREALAIQLANYLDTYRASRAEVLDQYNEGNGTSTEGSIRPSIGRIGGGASGEGHSGNSHTDQRLDIYNANVATITDNLEQLANGAKANNNDAESAARVFALSLKEGYGSMLKETQTKSSNETNTPLSKASTGKAWNLLGDLD